jgi:DNA mismatch repair ATPase MutS
LQNGVHFTTPKLERLGSRLKEIQDAYKEKQATLVTKAVETALTYLPLAEAASALVAELDTLSAFATAAALSPANYVRPKIIPAGSGVLSLKVCEYGVIVVLL